MRSLFFRWRRGLGAASGWARKNFSAGRRANFSGEILWPLLAVVLGFTVLRNLPAFAYLSP